MINYECSCEKLFKKLIKLFSSHLPLISFNLISFSFSRRTTIEQLNNEINALDKRIVTIKKQIDLPSTEEDIKLQMAEFLKVINLLNLFLFT